MFMKIKNFKDIMIYSVFCSSCMLGALFALNKTEWYSDYASAVKEGKEYLKWYNKAYNKR